MPIQEIADTALLTAYARAMESQRLDALFRDPHALVLAGERGAWLAAGSTAFPAIAGSVGCRTAVIDELVLRTIEEGDVGLVLNLAAGLDARPFRLELPPELTWVDVDLPHVLAYKSVRLEGAEPFCHYEQMPADLGDREQLKTLFEYTDREENALVLSEGVLVYLSDVQVGALASGLQATQSMKWWITDLAGPRALAMMASSWGDLLKGVQFQFGPTDPAALFCRYGWKETEFRSSQAEARRLGRSLTEGLVRRFVLRVVPAKIKREIQRLSGVAVFERVEMKK